jgi:NAD(P)H-hydrate epimerase
MSITRDQASEIDRRAAEEFGMPSLLLMENAGRGAAGVIDRLQLSGPFVICCGVGNNGGDGFVMARHLDLRRKNVRVLIWGERRKTSRDAAANLAILENCELPIEHFDGDTGGDRLAQSLADAGCVIDALLGTGARGEPRPPLDTVIDAINACHAMKVAVDLPSGMDCDTGQCASHTVRADHTCTFVARKRGFDAPHAAIHTGEVHVVDIGAPRVLVERVLGSD